jgi:MOSC domain-containing protein
MPFIDRITIFPVKSLDGVRVDEARVLGSGALEHDREFAIFDEQEKLINGKRTSRVHLLRSRFDLVGRTITLQVNGTGHRQTFEIDNENPELESWLSEYFGFSVKVKRIPSGLPDHLNTSGPTIVSTASLNEISNWLDAVSIDGVRTRFRANLEIAGVPAFWEDHLFGKPDTVVEFRVAEVRLLGVSPCERCVVPSRDPLTGERYPQFQKIIATRRKQSMPAWVETSAFPHFYHFCVLTRVPQSEAGKILKVGDKVRVP